MLHAERAFHSISKKRQVNLPSLLLKPLAMVTSSNVMAEIIFTVYAALCVFHVAFSLLFYPTGALTFKNNGSRSVGATKKNFSDAFLTIKFGLNVKKTNFYYHYREGRKNTQNKLLFSFSYSFSFFPLRTKEMKKKIWKATFLWTCFEKEKEEEVKDSGKPVEVKFERIWAFYKKWGTIHMNNNKELITSFQKWRLNHSNEKVFCQRHQPCIKFKTTSP